MQRGGGSGVRVVLSGGAYLTIVDGVVKVGRGSGVREVSPGRTNVARARAGGGVLPSGAGTVALRSGAALGAVIARGTGAGALVGGATFGTVPTGGAGASALVGGAARWAVTTSSAGAGALVSGAASRTVTTSGAGAGALVGGATFRTVSTSGAGRTRGRGRPTERARCARSAAVGCLYWCDCVLEGAGVLGRGSVNFGFVCVFVSVRAAAFSELESHIQRHAATSSSHLCWTDGAHISHLSLFELLKVPPVHGTQASSVSP